MAAVDHQDNQTKVWVQNEVTEIPKWGLSDLDPEGEQNGSYHIKVVTHGDQITDLGLFR